MTTPWRREATNDVVPKSQQEEIDRVEWRCDLSAAPKDERTGPRAFIRSEGISMSAFDDVIGLLRLLKVLEGALCWALLLVAWNFSRKNGSERWPSPFVLAFALITPGWMIWDLVIEPWPFSAHFDNLWMVVQGALILFPVAPVLLSMGFIHAGLAIHRARLTRWSTAKYAVVALQLVQALYMYLFLDQWRIGETNA